MEMRIDVTYLSHEDEVYAAMLRAAQTLEAGFTVRGIPVRVSVFDVEAGDRVSV